MWAVPNGENRNPQEAARMKAMGLLAGVWDLHLFWHGEFHIFECKVGRNTLTRDRVVKTKRGPARVYGQQEWGELMAAHGAHRHVFRTVDEGLAQFAEIMQPRG
jgi:hypothetical protein